MRRRVFRQEDLVPHERMAQVFPIVVGCGAIGRQVACQLAMCGAAAVGLIDFDTVDKENLLVQGYMPKDLGRLKVDALADTLLDYECVAERRPVAITENSLGSLIQTAFEKRCFEVVLISAVDTIDVRRAMLELFENTPSCTLFIDGRTVGETMRCLTTTRDPGAIEVYRKTLFSAEEAVPGSCTARATIYSSNVVAGLMVHQFVRYLRGAPCSPSLMYCMPTDNFQVNPQEDPSWDLSSHEVPVGAQPATS